MSMDTNMIAEVIVDVKVKALNRPFHYAVPEHLVSVLQPGHRVAVSFGRQQCQGYVLNVTAKGGEGTQLTLKPIERILDEQPILSTELLALGNWMGDRYLCTAIQAFSAMIPGAFRLDGVGAKQQPWLLALRTSTELEAHATSIEHRAPAQARLLRLLAQTSRLDMQQAKVRPSDAAVRSLVQQGLVRLDVIEVQRDAHYGALREEPDGLKIPTVAQARALLQIRSALQADSSSVLCLHGVTGSGKTQVYLDAIESALESGLGAIVLVPEISLTPQMLGRFLARFGARVAVLHSGLSVGEKRDEWMRVQLGAANIVVGARSAVFAPVHNLSLIIIDEEHETSYKQEEAPRYDAREVARWRMDYYHGVTVLGSATPSLNTMREVEASAIGLLPLPLRANGKPLPPVDIVDMRDELKQGNRSLFSTALQHGLETAISRGQQAILFLNRRGYAAFLMCRNCGDVLECPHCDISLTLHKSPSQSHLVCHYCGHRTVEPTLCPSCAEPAMRPYGVGTQQIEQGLRERWPAWRVLRMDVDTMRKKGAHQHAIQQFMDGEADILLGTQMIAKGLDFPRVTFVGVIAADTMLAVPDYRSAERTFNLLTQVLGRAGRATEDGHTVLQTYRPEHFAIQAAARHDYGAFYRQELTVRQAFTYPPYCELCVFVATHAQEQFAAGAARRFERELRRRLQEDDVTILPATPTSVSRVEDKFRYQVVVKYLQWARVQVGVSASYHLVADLMHKHRGTCTIDVAAASI